MKLMIIIFFSSLIMFLVSGCSFPVMAPDTSGEIRIELLHIETTFDLHTQTIYIFNKNWNPAHVRISRYTSGGYGDDPWLDIVNVYIWGRCSREFKAYFETGDQIEILVKVEGLEGSTYEIGS